MRRVASNPEGPLTTDQTGLLSGIRSFHIRHSRKASREKRVAKPVHLLFYRSLRPGLVEVVRILHERMDRACILARKAILIEAKAVPRGPRRRRSMVSDPRRSERV